MKLNKEIMELVSKMEYMVGSSCYNPNSYDGWNMVEGCSFRYPVYVRNGAEEEKFRSRVQLDDMEMVNSMKYKFGSNHLYIGRALLEILKYLEQRYGIDFNELEEKRKKK